MKKFIIVSGGCRGEMDDCSFVAAPSLKELVNEMAREAVGDVINNYMQDDELSAYEAQEAAEQEIEEFSIGGAIYATQGRFGNVGCVSYGEESWCMIVEATEEVFEELQAFADDDTKYHMFDFEEFVGLDYSKELERF